MPIIKSTPKRSAISSNFSRDIGVIWKFVAVVVAVIAAVGGIVGTLIVWGNSLERTDAQHGVRLDGVEKDLEKLQRDFRWHERTHGQPAPQPPAKATTGK